MRPSLKSVGIASILACTVLLSSGWSKRDGLSLSVSRAEAATRVYVRGGYRGPGHHTATGLSWYAVRAYYFGGPWSGPGYSYAGWDDYAARGGIGCRPGTAVN